MVKVSSEKCSYPLQGGRSIKVTKDDIVSFVYFLVRRLTLDNRGPSHPQTYDSTILQSDLFKAEVFGAIIDSPISGENVDRYNNSRLKNVFIQFLGSLCSNDPAIISTIIDNGLLKKVTDMISSYIPVHSVSVSVLMEFLREVTIHEKGREFIKGCNVFEKIIMPLCQAQNE